MVLADGRKHIMEGIPEGDGLVEDVFVQGSTFFATKAEVVRHAGEYFNTEPILLLNPSHWSLLS